MKLSVITINFNNRDGLRKTIESVVNQTYKDFEYIVIDGGSTDGSVDVIKEYADRIDYWVSEPDKGIYNAMNKGIDVAKGEYCLFLNSGDFLFNSNVLNGCISYLDGIDVITGALKVDSGYIIPAPLQVTIPFFYSFDTLSHPASFIKTRLLKKYHYDEKLALVSDWKFFTKVLILDGASYKSIREIIAIFDTTGISSLNKEQCHKEQAYVLENDFPKCILEYYRFNTEDIDVQLFNEIRKKRYRRYLYTLNVFVLRLLTLFKRESWIRHYPLNFNKGIKQM